jgi:hypothetical protein
MRNKRMLSPSQYAEEIGRPYQTVMTWLKNGELPQAIKQDTPTGHFWVIPEGTDPPALKRGRPKKTTPIFETKPTAKKRTSKKAGN